MLNWVLKTMKQSLGPIRFSLVRFCLFWGLPCPLPLTRANDDVLYIKASNRGRRKAFWNQRKWIWIIMTPFWAISLFCLDKRIVISLRYAFLFIAGIIAATVGYRTMISGSPEIQTRKELARLRAKALVQEQPGESLNTSLGRLDIGSRVCRCRKEYMSPARHLKKSSFGPRLTPRRT